MLSTKHRTRQTKPMKKSNKQMVEYSNKKFWIVIG